MRVLILCLLSFSMMAGCASNDPIATDDPTMAPEPMDHVLDGTIEPAALLAPTFQRLGGIATGAPVLGVGEPSAWVALDGTLYVAFPGCDRGNYLVGQLAQPLPGDEACGHGLVYRSIDDGMTWERLNQDGTGRYTDEGPAANGDADVAVDAAGNVYASNLGSGIQFHTYWAENQTWEYMANVVPQDEGADRQWMAAGEEGHVIMTWMRTSPARDVEINVTFDGGRTWTHAGNHGGLAGGFNGGIGWLGTVQIAPDGDHAYIPYTQPLQAGAAPLVSGPSECAMRVLVSDNGGLNWTDVDTGARWAATQTGGHWSCVHMAPAIDVTGDGSVVVAWSADRSINDAVALGQGLYAIMSKDNGTTWSDVVALPTSWDYNLPTPRQGSGIMPWVAGGAGDRFAVTYLFTTTLSDQDYVAATWDVRAQVIDGFGTTDQVIVESVIEPEVHVGGICTRGGACLLTASDRSFLDFFEADVTPDGRLFVTYAADLESGKFIEIRTAIQNGGTPLLERVPVTA